ncbi:MAG: ABC-2 type transport system permease protein [Parvicellaceae bacterium]|jgi:ABC-2 type transport system permease protein
MGINKNLYRKDLYRNRRGIFIWGAILIGITLMLLAIFPIMSNMQDEMGSLMGEVYGENMTESMGLDKMFSDILSFYSTYYGVYIIMLLSIFSTITATGIIAREERTHTSEFLYVKPITRAEVFWSKFLVLITCLGIVYILQVGIALIGIQLFKTSEVNISSFIAMNLHGLILALLFSCVGLFLSIYLRPKKSFMGVVLGLVFGMFFLDAISKLADSVNFLGYISPFHYLGFQVSDPEFGFNTIPAIVFIGLSVTLIVLALKKFQKKDILG